MNNEQKELSKTEKAAIILNASVFIIVVVSGIIRILVECNVLKSFKDSLAYNIIDGIIILIAVVLFVAACVLEKRLKNQENNKQNETKKRKHK